jgi:hypothetical protein
LQNLKSGLRSGDALHIAIAVNSISKVTRLLTLDKGFIKSARGIDVPVEMPW